MSGFQLDFNPFPEKETVNLTDDERHLLFENAHSGDEEALKAMVALYAPMAESIIRQHQRDNIAPRYTFTELYDAGSAALKRAIMTADERTFNKHFDNLIRQAILQLLMKVNVRGFLQDFQLDFNPFPEKETVKITDDERHLIFENAHNGDEEALNTLVALYAPMVEATIFQYQLYNIPPKCTFTELYDAGIAALKRGIITADEKMFDRLGAWWIRQAITFLLSEENMRGYQAPILK